MFFQRLLAICFALLTAALGATAQTSTSPNVPPAVASAFKNKYPDVKNVRWSQPDAKAYEADFEAGGTAYTASFFQDGKWLQTESDVENDDLPKTVKDKIAKDFNGYLITDAELIDTHDKGRTYSVHVERGEEELILTFDEDGKLLKREKDDDEG